MHKREVFVARDGAEFDQEADAQAHETRLDLLPLAEIYLGEQIGKQKSLTPKRAQELMVSFAVAMLDPNERSRLDETAVIDDDDTDTSA